MISRAELAEHYREDDKARAEHAEWMARRHAAASPLVQKSDDDGLLYRMHEENASLSVLQAEPMPANGDGAETDWSGWERWMQGHLDIHHEQMFDAVAEAFALGRADTAHKLAEAIKVATAEVTQNIRAEREATLAALIERDRKIANLEGELRETKSMLGDVLRRYEQTTKAIADIEARAAAEAERIREIKQDVRDELQILDAKQDETARLYVELRTAI